MIKEGSLYPALHKLKDEGLVQTESEMIDNRVRKYYSLTPSGTITSTERVKELNEFFETLKVVLSPSSAMV